MNKMILKRSNKVLLVAEAQYSDDVARYFYITNDSYVASEPMPNGTMVFTDFTDAVSYFLLMTKKIECPTWETFEGGE